MKRLNTITDVPGIKVGHASDLKALICYPMILGEQSLIESVKRTMTKDG